MKKQVIRLTEGDLHRIIKESVNRILKEDVMSLVDNYFMPYGFESDQYHILGEILEIEEVKNVLGEIYGMED